MFTFLPFLLIVTLHTAVVTSASLNCQSYASSDYYIHLWSILIWSKILPTSCIIYHRICPVGVDGKRKKLYFLNLPSRTFFLLPLLIINTHVPATHPATRLFRINRQRRTRMYRLKRCAERLICELIYNRGITNRTRYLYA